MAAALGANLVLDMDGGSAELAHRAHGTGNVEGRGAKTGIDIHQQRQVAHVGDAAHVGEYIVQAADAQVRQAQRTGGDAATGQVDGLEAGALGQQGMVGVDGANHLQRMFSGNGVAETLTGGALHSHFSPRGLLLWASR
ncbi:hypothetical protein D3C72_1136110 [compost metagenome]